MFSLISLFCMLQGLDGKFNEQTGRHWSSNFFSRLTFWEATSLVRRGAQRALEFDDLWRIRADMTAQENWRRFSKHWKEETKLPVEKYAKELKTPHLFFPNSLLF